MKFYVKYEDTDKEYEIPLHMLLPHLKLDASELEAAVLKVLQQT